MAKKLRLGKTAESRKTWLASLTTKQLANLERLTDVIDDCERIDPDPRPIDGVIVRFKASAAKK